MSEETKFRIMRQGYDRFEVDKAMREMAYQSDLYVKELALQKQKIATLVSQRDNLNLRLEKMNKDIGIRERAAEEMARLALREANSIIETAYTNADLIVREALSSARQLLVEISRISTESQDIKEDLNNKIFTLYGVLQGLEFPEVPNVKLVGKDQDTKE